MLSLNPFGGRRSTPVEAPKPAAPSPAPVVSQDQTIDLEEAIATTDTPEQAEATDAPRAWPPADGPHLVRHDQITPSPLNPRRGRGFDQGDIEALAQSIARDGLLQNLTVRPSADKGRYELIAGERRWRAIGLLIERGDWDRAARNIRVAIRRASDIDAIRVALAENSVRRDMHELDEAEGLAALRELMIADGAEVGAVMDDLANSYGRTRRWIEQRLALVTHLTDVVKTAWREEALNLAMAKTLARFDAATQASALANVSAGLAGWRLPAEVAESLSRGGVPARVVIFDPADYDGPLERDEAGAPLAYLDRAQAARLQVEAAQDLVAGELSDGATFADLVTDPEDLAAYVGGGDGAVVIVHPETLEVDVRRDLGRRSEHTQERAAPSTPSPADPVSTDPAATAEDHETGAPVSTDRTPQPRAPIEQGSGAGPRAATSSPAAFAPAAWPRDAWAQGAAWRTVALQQALSGAPARIARAALIAGALADPHERGEVVRLGVRTRGGAGCDALLGAFAAVGLGEHVERFGDRAETRNAAALFRALLTLTDDQLDVVFVALIASLIEIQRIDGGDDPLTLAIAEATDAEDTQLGFFELSETWLEAYPVEVLRAVARDMGLNGDAMPAAKQAAIEWILEHPARDQGWTPHELVFARPEEARAEAARILTPPRAAAAE